MLWKTICWLAFISVFSFEIAAGQLNPTTQLHDESPTNETESPSPHPPTPSPTAEKNPVTTQKTDPEIPQVPPVITEPSTKSPKENHRPPTEEEIRKWIDFDLKRFHEMLKPRNDSVVDKGTHRYYNSTVYNSKAARNLWKILTEANSTTHNILSDSHMTAATEKLKFEFPFYGYKLKEVTIATGGFLSTGNDRDNNMLAVAQYIAPLMANFDTRLSLNSSILYYDDGEVFVVEWRSVHLKDSNTNSSFTFQTHLHKAGDIVFIYKDVPIPIPSISDKTHPVKVGLSDAFTMNRNIEHKNLNYNRKVFIEYHKIDHGTADITNWTAIYYTALPVCLMQETCDDCTSTIAGFQCMWCPALNTCSDGTDRNREKWIKKKCQLSSFSNATTCDMVNNTDLSNDGTGVGADDSTKSRSTGTVTDVVTDDSVSQSTNDDSDDTGVGGDGEIGGMIGLRTDDRIGGRPSESKASKRSALSSSAITTVLVIMCFVILIAGWVLYAYFHPHSASGQLLIKYRPSRFRWRRGEPSYTAAAIHM